jgi:hypothetical protein
MPAPPSIGHLDAGALEDLRVLALDDHVTLGGGKVRVIPGRLNQERVDPLCKVR